MLIADCDSISFGVALIACVLAYDGWVQLASVAGEIRNPQRNVLLALAFGSAACIAIYVLANMAYMRVLSIDEIAVPAGNQKRVHCIGAIVIGVS